MTSANDRHVLLARLRVAACRIRLIRADIEEVVVLLSSGSIPPRGALYLLWENGLDHLVLADDELEGAP